MAMTPTLMMCVPYAANREPKPNDSIRIRTCRTSPRSDADERGLVGIKYLGSRYGRDSRLVLEVGSPLGVSQRPRA